MAAEIPLSTRDVERFWTKVRRSNGDGCWLWADYPNASGHGRLGVQVEGRTRPFYAHRISWQIHFGRIPDGSVVMHICDVPLCVRPDHLRLGTRAENLADCRAKGRWHNDPKRREAAPKPRVEYAERFWAKVDQSDPEGCWEWAGARSRRGYGLFWDSGAGRKIIASRVAYTLASGPIPDGLHVLHLCDNPPCCNPAHLYVGTNADNVRDRIARGREGDRSGERNGRAKLTDQQVNEIRARYTGWWGEQSALAREYRVDQTHISRIVRAVTR